MASTDGGKRETKIPMDVLEERKDDVETELYALVSQSIDPEKEIEVLQSEISALKNLHKEYIKITDQLSKQYKSGYVEKWDNLRVRTIAVTKDVNEYLDVASTIMKDLCGKSVSKVGDKIKFWYDKSQTYFAKSNSTHSRAPSVTGSLPEEGKNSSADNKSQGSGDIPQDQLNNPGAGGLPASDSNLAPVIVDKTTSESSEIVEIDKLTKKPVKPVSLTTPQLETDQNSLVLTNVNQSVQSTANTNPNGSAGLNVNAGIYMHTSQANQPVTSSTQPNIIDPMLTVTCSTTHSHNAQSLASHPQAFSSHADPTHAVHTQGFSSQAGHTHAGHSHAGHSQAFFPHADYTPQRFSSHAVLSQAMPSLTVSSHSGPSLISQNQMIPSNSFYLPHQGQVFQQQPTFSTAPHPMSIVGQPSRPIMSHIPYSNPMINTSNASGINTHFSVPNGNFVKQDNISSPIQANPSIAVTPQQSASVKESEPVFMAISRHMLQQDLLKRTIEPYDGDAIYFWPWVGKIREFIQQLGLNPRQTLEFIESNSKGSCKRFIANKLAAIPMPTENTVQGVWAELIQRFGSSQKITAEIKNKIREFPAIKSEYNGSQLLELYDLCEVAWNNMPNCPELTDLNLASGLYVIRQKLPISVQKAWAKFGDNYEQSHWGNHPPFDVFLNWFHRQAHMMSNDHYQPVYSNSKDESKTKTKDEKSGAKPKTYSKVMKTDVSPPKKDKKPGTEYCYLHNTLSHGLPKCRWFKSMTYNEKRDVLYKNWLCSKCMGCHSWKECPNDVTCDTCAQDTHMTIMHKPSRSRSDDKTEADKPIETEKETATDKTKEKDKSKDEVKAHCTKICGGEERSCSKTVLVELTFPDSKKTMTGYAIVDDHANQCLIDESVIEFFSKEFPRQEYTMQCASQQIELDTVGYLVTGLKVKGVKKNEILDVPPTFTCIDLADNRREVATPAIVRSLDHAAKYVKEFPEFDPDARVLILIGRNCGRAIYSNFLTEEIPYVVDTPLGFALIGESCPDKAKNGACLSVLKTSVTPSITTHLKYAFCKPAYKEIDVFQKYDDDEEPALSQEDKEFLIKVSDGVKVNDDGNLEVPLPLKSTELSNNSYPVKKRMEKSFERLRKDQNRLSNIIEAMQKNIDRGYVEEVPIYDINNSNPKWYIPTLAVRHPKKQKDRIVNDASYRLDGKGINDLLLQGPDLNNQMDGVFLRFREHPVAYSADIQDMFLNFRVPQDQWDLLRFYWPKDNDPNSDLVPYRAKTHVFGLRSSPGVASYCLKMCALRPLTHDFEKAQEYITNSFYVDDGLGSSSTIEEATEVLSKAVTILKPYNVRLHKILSNQIEVIENFPASERAVDTNKPMDTSKQRVLGVMWDTVSDTLVMEVSLPHRPFTKRGILSVLGSIYDRIGLVCPVTLAGRLFAREIMPPKGKSEEALESYGWDDPLPEDRKPEYERWLRSLDELNNFAIPRGFYPLHGNPQRQELHVFCDSSDNAIGYVAYMRTIDQNNDVHVRFVKAGSKVAPRSANSMPRLELCGAAEGASHAHQIVKELKSKPDQVYMHTDSLVVLGYLRNTEKHFSKYVERRVALILNLMPSETWHYISTKENPADIATRCHTPSQLRGTCWLTGPMFLLDPTYKVSEDVLQDVHLPEEKAAQVAMKTELKAKTSLLIDLCNRGFNYSKCINILNCIMTFKTKLQNKIRERKTEELEPLPTFETACSLAVRLTQRECFEDAIKLMKKDKSLPESHQLADLAPFLDDKGIVRVGGRLKHADIAFSNKHPMLLPYEHPFSEIVVSHYHRRTYHQGSHISHSLIRQAGYHIVHGKRLIRKVVKDCVLCKQLRGPFCTQFMSDFPADRLEETVPFANVGLDVFGPYYISEGKNTRRSKSLKKIWALIFVCLPSRAIHIEHLESMDTSSFRNALRRFIAIRGTCRIIRSDQGTNFMGAKRQLDEVDIEAIAEDLKTQKIEWIVNPPHSSHKGGTWERKIACVRRVLEGALKQLNLRTISREEFITLIAEASAIVNQTPLWTNSSDANDPAPLTPSMLITMRQDNDIVKDEFSERDLMSYGPKRHRRVQYLVQQFWVRWRTEHLQDLTRRHKWKTKKDACVTVGDVVLLRDKQLPRNDWPLGRITEVKKSQDGLVRSVMVKLPSRKAGEPCKQYARPISELVLLVRGPNHPCTENQQPA